MKEEKISELGEQVTKLQEEVAGLQQQEATIQTRVTKEEDERKARNELGSIQKEIEIRENEVKRIREEIMSVNRATALCEAEGLAEKKKKNLAENVEIDQRGLELQEIFEQNILMKKIQTSSAVFIRVRKQIESPSPPSFDLHGFPVPTLPKQFHSIEDTASAMNLAAYLSDGWELVPGESVPPQEVLTPENSILRGTVSMPDVFLDFLPTQPLTIRVPIPIPVAKKK